MEPLEVSRQRTPSPTIGGDLPEAKINEAQYAPMVVVRADERPAVNAMEYRAKRGRMTKKCTLIKPRLEGVREENADTTRLAVSR